MKKLFEGNGFLTKEGKEAFGQVQNALEQVLSDACRDMDEAQLLTVHAAMAKMVSDTMSWHMQAKRDLRNKFAAMSNEQFEGFLRAKYGEKWRFISLTKEELDRVPHLTQEQVKESLSKGIKAAIEFYESGPLGVTKK